MGPIENGESVPGDPDGRHSRRPLAVGGVRVLVVALLGDHVQVGRAVLQIRGPAKSIRELRLQSTPWTAIRVL